MTKFKGRVASIAPGLLVASTAAVLFSGSMAHAGECGTEAKGQGNNSIQDSITCAADADPNTNGRQAYDNGITYRDSDGLTLILDDADIKVGGSGVKVVGGNRDNSGGGNISVQLLSGEVITKDKLAWGLYAQILDKASQATVAVTAEVAEGG
ncbi:hypothetical protein [Yoonia sp. R2-816]|uniref:hypothetical protein n=1 Tax=Yoonia sp. R2-816 TaxID=3342638 RepID=UPI003727C8CB